MGRRLGELTRDNTKCMVEVNGIKLIDRTLTQLSRLSLNKVVIVTGYKGRELEAYVGSEYKGLKIEYIYNPVYDRTNNIYSLSLAKDRLQEDDTLLIESDLIFDDALFPMIVDNPYPDLAMVAKYESWMDGTMVCIDDADNIVNFVPKAAFEYADAGHYYKTVNIYKFSREFSRNEYVPFLDAYSKVMGNNEYYEQVLRVLTLLNSSTMKALPIGDERWYEIDDVQDLDIASTIFSSDVTKYHEYHKRYGGFWRFPKLLDYCYLVNPFFPTRRMKDEIKANFDTLLTQYPSGMWVNSLLAGKYFGIAQDYVAVGNGAAELIKVVMEEHSGDRVGVVFPTFDEYPNRLKEGWVVPYIPENENFTYGAAELEEFFGRPGNEVSMLLLINPDNPSGNFIPKRDVLHLAGWCEDRGVALLVDESFVDFTDDAQDNSLLHNGILEEYPHLMVMKSISKSYGVPGLRLGVFASGDRELIARIKKEVPIWNINSFAEFYLQIYGKYEKDYALACEKFRAEREIFFGELQKIPYLRVIPSQANYFLCEVTARFTSAELTQKLIENDVIISNCGLKRNMIGRNLVRFAIRDRKDNARLVEILGNL